MQMGRKVSLTLVALVAGTVVMILNKILVEIPLGFPILYTSVPIMVFCFVIGLLPKTVNRDIYGESSEGRGSNEFNTFAKLTGIFQFVITSIVSWSVIINILNGNLPGG
ncbi:MAG: hypothetical protein MPL62_15610, partial [Alphaproteobacteria bacterium]|nr:hypothetical protein [Alphaproteobacteria bacterium]